MKEYACKCVKSRLLSVCAVAAVVTLISLVLNVYSGVELRWDQLMGPMPQSQLLDTINTTSAEFNTTIRIRLPMSNATNMPGFYHQFDCVHKSLWDSYNATKWSDLDKDRLTFMVTPYENKKWIRRNTHLIQFIYELFATEIIEPSQPTNIFDEPNGDCELMSQLTFSKSKLCQTPQFISFVFELRYFMAKRCRIDNIIAESKPLRFGFAFNNGSNNSAFVNALQTIENNIARQESRDFVRIQFKSNESIVEASSQLTKNVIIIQRSAKSRIIANIDGLINDLSIIFGDNSHFSVIWPAQMDLCDMGRTIANASLVIAAHGADLSMLPYFISTETPMIEIAPWNWHCYCTGVGSPKFFAQRFPWLNFHSYATMLPDTTCVSVCDKYRAGDGRTFRKKKDLFVYSQPLAKLILAIDSQPSDLIMIETYSQYNGSLSN